VLACVSIQGRNGEFPGDLLFACACCPGRGHGGWYLAICALGSPSSWVVVRQEVRVVTEPPQDGGIGLGKSSAERSYGGGYGGLVSGLSIVQISRSRNNEIDEMLVVQSSSSNQVLS